MANRTPKIVQDVQAAIGTPEFPRRFMAAKEWVEEQLGKIQDAATLDNERRADAQLELAPRKGR